MAGDAGRRQWPRDYGEPYNSLPRPRGGSAFPTKPDAQGWWVGGEWIEAPPERPSTYDRGSRASPVIIEDDDASDCYEMPPPVACISHAGRGAGAFDFNDGGQDVPWAMRAQHGRTYEAIGRSRAIESIHLIANVQPRSFTDSADDELLLYLAGRSISRGFLVEIDQFFCSHPEIANCPEGRDTIRQLNSLSPLDAYRYFLRGYTRPARYVDGLIKSEYFSLPAGYAYQPLSRKVDPELDDFFEGFEYRWDIIGRIDLAVRGAIQALARGQPVNSGWRRLVCYAVWGNPADAYKWYEYQLQEEYLPHRYLPEHVVLGHLPKLAGEAAAQPSSLNTSRRHMKVRYTMARANDEGIDVLDVLMTEFKAALVRKGFRRVDIDELYARGKERLEHERRDPRGVDIVDLIMDEVPAQRPARRSHVNTGQYTHHVPNGFRHNAISSRRPRRKRANKAKAKNVPPALRKQAAELQSAKANLERAYAHEQNVQNLSSQCIGVTFNLPEVIASRARAERRYVNCLIRYLRDSNEMSAVEARQLQGSFTKHKMEKAGVNNCAYLLGMHPSELS
ncbi:hypothetical protein E8E12_006774 [Didymella heteroderae]|uniref:Uncharacterized protein n=1 Tax=Didymella heteroderae TaxID=1769908 RepID=A0A9P4WL20_9PLEO|nr:hypothetical protein E8E12_006774 [Didymella heteroderae]